MGRRSADQIDGGDLLKARVVASLTVGHLRQAIAIGWEASDRMARINIVRGLHPNVNAR